MNFQFERIVNLKIFINNIFTQVPLKNSLRKIGLNELDFPKK